MCFTFKQQNDILKDSDKHKNLNTKDFRKVKQKTI